MWMIGHYLPVAPFSLKSAAATASGGKTLLVPTPYAMKMALLDVALRTLGLAEGERLFPLLRDLSIWFEAPDDIIVIKGFGKIQRLLKDKSDGEKAQEAQTRGHWPMQPTIAYREHAYYRDPFRLAIASPDGTTLPDALTALLMHINYFGRRGGFVQIMEPPRQVAQLPAGRFVELTASQMSSYYRDGTLQMLDDCGPTLTFQQASIYSEKRVTIGKERVIRHVVLPYYLERSSRGYSWYKQIQEA
jgi:hypothetical protein